MSDFVVPGVEYLPFAEAVKILGCSTEQLLILAQSGRIELHQYPDPTTFIEQLSINPVAAGVMLLRGKNAEKRYAELVACFEDLDVRDLVLLRAEIFKAHHILKGAPLSEHKAEYITAKQCRFIVELLRLQGLTDDDFKGSIPELRQKIARRGITETYGDDKTLTDWLEKAKVR